MRSQMTWTWVSKKIACSTAEKCWTRIQTQVQNLIKISSQSIAAMVGVNRLKRCERTTRHDVNAMHAEVDVLRQKKLANGGNTQPD